MTLLNNHTPSGLTLERDTFLMILRAANQLEEYRFARRAALSWMAVYPGDLPVTLLYAQSLLRTGRPDLAEPILREVTISDPEYQPAIEAWFQASTALRASQPKKRRKYQKKSIGYFDQIGWLLALDVRKPLGDEHTSEKKSPQKETAILWSRTLAKARRELARGRLSLAEQALIQSLALDPPIPLVASTHLRLIYAQVQDGLTPPETLHNLAVHYHQKWPDCIQCNLFLAEALMGSGKSDEAVALLHGVVTRDITGQVARRIWGTEHPYRAMWPEKLSLNLDIPLPATIATTLGWNRLPSSHPPEARGQTAPASLKSLPDERPNPPSENDSTEPTTESGFNLPETLVSIQAELEKIGQRLGRPEVVQSDGRFPVYVVMTTRHGMQEWFGQENAALVEAEMKRLVASVARRKDWNALLFYADEGTYIRENTTRLNRPAVRYNDPWGLKLALADLDAALKTSGERIGAVLIVGGPEIVPFHRLPNPVDDADDDIPSDNPYSTLDENYFIPEWPVGRLPDGCQDSYRDPEPLIKILQSIRGPQGAMPPNEAPTAWYLRLLDWLISLLTMNRASSSRTTNSSIGYSAAVWRQASLRVYRPIGDPKSLRVSPPIGTLEAGTQKRQGSPLPNATFAYFNLHGLEDAVEWFGQRDPSNGDPPPDWDHNYDYPVAVRPEDIQNSGKTPEIVFTEACYGAHILGKSPNEALALQFLRSGCKALVGSTSIAYGSISAPLIAADFLGQQFWRFIRHGYPAGEALRRAKIALAGEMHSRQGYLDGEDQKTLISFVLYGDPLATPHGFEATPKAIRRAIKSPTPVPTVCDRQHDDQQLEPVSPEILGYVKRVVEQYLPGMSDAALSVSREHIDCNGPHPPASCQLQTGAPNRSQAKSNNGTREPKRQVVTLSKEYASSSGLHRHYARLTLDADGKLVKLVVSR